MSRKGRMKTCAVGKGHEQQATATVEMPFPSQALISATQSPQNAAQNLPTPAPHTFLALPCMVCEILVPGSRTQTWGPWQCKPRVLTTGLPRTPSPTCLQHSRVSACPSGFCINSLSEVNRLFYLRGQDPVFLLDTSYHRIMYATAMIQRVLSNKREILSPSPGILVGPQVITQLIFIKG